MLELRRLRFLQEFAQRGTIVATAQALGYTPSAVSQQLSALEREAGTPLLDRTARGAELTDAGRRLAEHAERILAMVEAAESDLAADTSEPMGQVVITAFPTAALTFAPVLAGSLLRHPGLTFRLRQAGPTDALRQTRSGEVDVAIVDDWTGRLPELSPGPLTFELLLHDPVVLVVPRDHWAADPAVPLDLTRLRRQPWLAAPAGEPSRNAVDQILADVGGPPTVPWEFEGLDTIVGLVARGVGIAAVPSLTLVGAASAGGEPHLAVRELPSAPFRFVYATVRSASLRRPAVGVTLAALRVAASDIVRQRGAVSGPPVADR
jgi:DNA-binding transcriptional LysR family regulator